MASLQHAKEVMKLTHSLCIKRNWLSGAKLASFLIAYLLIILSLTFSSYASDITEAQLDEREFNSALIGEAHKRLASNNESLGRVTAAPDLMVHEREFVSPQVKIQIECQRDKTVIKVSFSQPFNGTLGAGKLDTTQCKLNGNGTRQYEIQVKHNSSNCDTQWDSANSSIFNTLFIRYHPSLETGKDLAKNVMCRLTVGDLVVGRRPLKASSKISLIPPNSPNSQTNLVPKNVDEPSLSSSISSGGGAKIESLLSEVNI